jgi:hypothetical protein
MKTCSAGDDCRHPDGPHLPESAFGTHRGKLRARCKACVNAAQAARSVQLYNVVQDPTVQLYNVVQEIREELARQAVLLDRILSLLENRPVPARPPSSAVSEESEETVVWCEMCQILPGSPRLEKQRTEDDDYIETTVYRCDSCHERIMKKKSALLGLNFMEALT